MPLEFLMATAVIAQDLIPRAYLVSPTGSNAVTLSYSWNDGTTVFDPSVPIDNFQGTFQVSTFSYYHSYSFFGRSSNFVVSLPYMTGDFKGVVLGNRTEVYRSGLADARFRFSVNLHGGPAMGLGQFMQWREKGLLGFSISAVVPMGQHDPARLVNAGTNRWAFKPEIGLTRRWGRWMVEGYGGVWVFGPNSHFYPGMAKRTQMPIFAPEGHFGYYLKPRLWVSFDANVWLGGRSSVNGTENDDVHRDTRMGVTMSVPVRRHQSIKFSFSRGAYVRVGGNYSSISVAWQYSWIGKPQ